MTRSCANTDCILPTRAVAEHLDAMVRDKNLRVPMLKHVVGEVLQMASSDETGAAEISDALHHDQNLAGQVLKAANSPLFGGRTEITDLQAALTRLGLRQTVNIVLMAVVKADVFRQSRYEDLMVYLWRHSVATGCFVREVNAVLPGMTGADFVCGLFHSVGKAVVLSALEEFEESRGVPIPQTEMLLAMSEYHMPVGAALAQSWNLPDPVQIAIRHYRDYDAAPGHREAAMAVNLASQLGTFLLCNDARPTAADTQAISELPVVADFGLSRREIAGLLHRLPRVRTTLESMDHR